MHIHLHPKKVARVGLHRAVLLVLGAVAAGAGTDALCGGRCTGLCADPAGGLAGRRGRGPHAAYAWRWCWWNCCSSWLLLGVPAADRAHPGQRAAPACASRCRCCWSGVNGTLKPLLAQWSASICRLDVASIKAFVLKYLNANFEDALRSVLASRQARRQRGLCPDGQCRADSCGAVLPVDGLGPFCGAGSRRADPPRLRGSVRQLYAARPTRCWVSTCAASCW